ncbi:MAG: hypothetical protein Q9175_006596 [Cornicularia normoerica]
MDTHPTAQKLNFDARGSSPRYRICWVAKTKLDGDRYRRGKIALTNSEIRFFSITTVYMDSEDVYSGQHHARPYGESNCVVQIDETAELKGM